MERQIIVSVSDSFVSVIFTTGDKAYQGVFNETAFLNFIELYQKLYTSTSNTNIKEYVKGKIFGFTTFIKVPDELSDNQMTRIGQDIYNTLQYFRNVLRTKIKYDVPENIFKDKFQIVKQLMAIFKLHECVLTEFGERYKNLISFSIKNVARYNQQLKEPGIVVGFRMDVLEAFASLIYSYTLFEYKGNLKIKLKNLFAKFNNMDFLIYISQIIINDVNITDNKFKEILKQLTILEGLNR